MGLSIDWSKEELEILQEYYPKIGPACAEYLANRTKSAIYAMASSKGIKREVRHVRRPVYDWSKEETIDLRYFYNGLELKEISTLISEKHKTKRSPQSIRGAAARLGIKFEIENGFSISEAVEMLDTTEPTLRLLMMKKGIPFIKIRDQRIIPFDTFDMLAKKYFQPLYFKDPIMMSEALELTRLTKPTFEKEFLDPVVVDHIRNGFRYLFSKSDIEAKYKLFISDYQKFRELKPVKPLLYTPEAPVVDDDELMTITHVSKLLGIHRQSLAPFREAMNNGSIRGVIKNEKDEIRITKEGACNIWKLVYKKKSKKKG